MKFKVITAYFTIIFMIITIIQKGKTLISTKHLRHLFHTWVTLTISEGGPCMKQVPVPNMYKTTLDNTFDLVRGQSDVSNFFTHSRQTAYGVICHNYFCLTSDGILYKFI